jgi:DNA ligase-1
MLASDLDLSKAKYPVVVEPKSDGCRLLHITGKATGRSLKPYKNKHTTAKFSAACYAGFDGEAFVGLNPYAQSLCRDTTSALNTITGEPIISWMVFDYLTEDTINLPYIERLEALREYLSVTSCPSVFIVPWKLVHNEEELLAFEKECLERGAEGIIIRDPQGMYKQGRSTVKEGGLLRLKRFADEEAVVVGVIEGKSNQNEAKTNELGHTERSTHQENMIPNGEVGTLLCQIGNGEVFKVSPGCMTQEECLYYFQNQDKLMGRTITFSHFPHGRKDAYRFATFKNFRAAEDMS